MQKLPIHHYKPFGPQSPTTTIFLHGYLGSHKNFNNIAKHVSNELNQRSVSLDLRNHGLTHPHVDNMSYRSLAQDLYRFIDIHKLHKVNLVGYSMGAKTILEYVLNEEFDNSVVDKIVCLDNSPMRLDNLGEEFQNYINVLIELKKWMDLQFNDVPHDKIPKNWRKLAMSYLEKTFGLSKEISLYFLDLFEIDFNDNSKINFKINNYLLSNQCLYELNDFEDYSNSPDININSLFIKGLKSDFITDQSWNLIQRLFKNLKLQTVNCDHKSLLITDVERMKSLITDHLR